MHIILLFILFNLICNMMTLRKIHFDLPTPGHKCGVKKNSCSIFFYSSFPTIWYVTQPITGNNNLVPCPSKRSTSRLCYGKTIPCMLIYSSPFPPQHHHILEKLSFYRCLSSYVHWPWPLYHNPFDMSSIFCSIVCMQNFDWNYWKLSLLTVIMKLNPCPA